jgi:hypothetical protein
LQLDAAEFAPRVAPGLAGISTSLPPALSCRATPFKTKITRG